MDSYTLLDAVARVGYGIDFDRYYAAPGDTVAESDARQRRRLDLRFLPKPGLPDITGLAETLDALRHEVSAFRLHGLWQESEQHERDAGAATAAERAAHRKIWRDAAERLRRWLAAGHLAAFDGAGKRSTEFWGQESVLKVLDHGYRLWAVDLQNQMTAASAPTEQAREVPPRRTPLVRLADGLVCLHGSGVANIHNDNRSELRKLVLEKVGLREGAPGTSDSTFGRALKHARDRVAKA